MTAYNKDFWRDLGERTLATFGQVAAAFLAAAIADGQGLLEVNWTTAISVIAMATLFAFFKGIGAAKVNPETGASFGTAIPRGNVAAVENVDITGDYTAEEASPYPEGTPVDVVLDPDRH